MKNYYNSEIEGMLDFYQTLGINKSVDYQCNTDGSINGCIIEFKLSFDKLLVHKNQIKRYLKAYNSIAKPIPAKALLIDINNHKYIEGNVTTKIGDISIEWEESEVHWETPSELAKFLNLKDYCKGWIDEESIVSYNNKFCLINNKNTTSKDEVKNEFINPKNLNIYPFDWEGQIQKEKSASNNNDWLTFNMNMLGSETLKKQLGAFFTPDKYVKISTEYVRNAIKNVPDGMDYVVIDRCAGSGNLEKFFTEEELKHFILNTIDYTEWTTLKGLYEGRVKHIIPHDAKTRNNTTGLMNGGDALQEGFYKKLLPLIEGKYIIMLENPPYADVGGKSGGHDFDNKSFVNEEMIKTVGGNHCNERGHQFIWSAWKYIKPNDYILFSPIKYWKLYKMSNKTLVDGCVCNSKLFNAPQEFAITLIHWKNVDFEQDSITLKVENTSSTVNIKKCKTKFHYDSNTYSSLPLARFRAESFMLNTSNVYLSNFDTNNTIWKRSKDFYQENAFNVLPLFCAKLKHYYYSDWTEKVIVCNSYDGGGSYLNDGQFLYDCFLYTCLSSHNRCISNNNITNQLRLLQGTIADSMLGDVFTNHKLVKLWNDVLDEIKSGSKPEYNQNYKYGLYQIERDINISIETNAFNKKGEPIKKKKYPLLDEKIDLLKIDLRSFYKTIIEPKLFLYELLK